MHRLSCTRLLRPKILGWITTLDYSVEDKKAYFAHQSIKQREIIQDVLQNKKNQLNESRHALQDALQEKKERFKESGQMLQEALQERKERFKESGQMIHGVLQEKKERFRESKQILFDDIKQTRDKMREKMEERENVLTIPNLLCISRIAISPVLGYLIIQSDFHLALGIFVFAGISDLRTLSRYFDVTHATAQLSPTAISKWNTGVQLLLVATTLAAPVFNYVDHPVLHAMWYVTAGTTLASAISYIISKNTYKFLRPQK
ncbi:hypothetical protein C0J52_09336 [Blattella germanica]|nr:hypothetical protein C0J52_09336 [Blattella germanica]